MYFYAESAMLHSLRYFQSIYTQPDPNFWVSQLASLLYLTTFPSQLVFVFGLLLRLRQCWGETDCPASCVSLITTTNSTNKKATAVFENAVDGKLRLASRRTWIKLRSIRANKNQAKAIPARGEKLQFWSQCSDRLLNRATSIDYWLRDHNTQHQS